MATETATRNYANSEACARRIRHARVQYDQMHNPPYDPGATGPLLQPVEEWDAIDRGRRGKVVSLPSARFKRNWGRIDWRK